MAEKLRHSAYIRLGRGVNRKTSLLTLESGEARVAVNCDRDTTNAIRKRNGSQRLYTFNSQPSSGIIFRSPVAGIYNHEWDYPCRGTIHKHLVVLADGSVWMDQLPSNGEYPPPPWDYTYFDRIDAKIKVENLLTRYVSFATVGGFTYIAVGKGRLRFFDGEQLFWAGIESPTDTPTATPVGATFFSGDYSYKITYIRRTDDGQFLESSVGPESAVASAVNQDVTVSWAAHPNAVATTNNGEYVTGYRIYRTFDQTLSTTDPQAFFLLTEITDLTTTSFVDGIDDLYLTDFAPSVRGIPPDGTKIVVEHSKSLFCLGSRFNRLGLHFSEPGQYETFPEPNVIRLPTASTEGITGAGKIAGTLVVTTEDRIFHVSGTNPRDFVHREMNEYTGCMAPGSMVSVNNMLVFIGRNGFYGWDGSNLVYLSEDIETEIEALGNDELKTAFADTYLKYQHYYCTLPVRPAGRTWWTYDTTSESISTDPPDDDGSGSGVRSSRAWFAYTGMPATAMGRVRKHGTREELLYYGDGDGNLFLFDVGDTDDGRPIPMQYQYLFKPYDRRNKHDLDSTFVLRNVILHTDKWVGTVRVGTKYLRSHVAGWIYRTFSRDYSTDAENTVRETDARFAGAGSSGVLVDITHETTGTFRVLGVSHEWKARRGGKRHVKV